jgi:hypothetical protein
MTVGRITKLDLEGVAVLAVTVVALMAAVTAVTAVTAERSHAAFGDSFGLADVNCPGEPEAPAFLPDAIPPDAADCAREAPGTSAFWAGVCDVASAPIGPIPNGVGARPDVVWTAETPPNSATNESVTAPTVPDHCIDWGRLDPLAPDHKALWLAPPAWRLAPVTQAGAHPDNSTTLWFRRYADRDDIPPDGSVDNIYTELPAGFAGDPTAVPKCSAEQFAHKPLACPPETQVGVITVYLWSSLIDGSNYQISNEERLALYNLEPRHGNVAELGFGNASSLNATTVRIVAKARTNGDFGVTAFSAQIPAALPLLASSITLWGTPWAASHDLWRPPAGWNGSDGLPPRLSFGEMPPGGLPLGTEPDLRVSYDRSWGRIRPFLSNPTECSAQGPSTWLVTDSFEHPGSFLDGFPDPGDANWKRYEAPSPPGTGCEKVPFAPSAAFEPSSTRADSASGLGVDITMPQNDELPFDRPPAGASKAVVDAYVADAESHWRSDAGLATSQLDKAVVTLPEGMSVNASGATGLQGCSDAEIGLRQLGNPNLFDNSEPTCPNGSKIGTVEATTPLLEGSPNLTGDVFLGAPKSTDPQSGEMLRIFLVLRNVERGLLAKVYGSAVMDPGTGRLTTTFDKNPRVPVENIKLSIQGGPRGLLAMPQTCGERSIESVLSPWSAAHGAGGLVRSLSDPFTVGGDCSFGFTPALNSGMSTKRARANGAFSFQFTRPEGQQWVQGLTAQLPPGLVAQVRGVPLCADSQAAAGACPQASKIGIIDAAAGSGSPFVLEEKGEVFLTRGYKGGAYGLMVKIRGIAGPFRGAQELSPIVVRQAVHVDPTTAQVRAVSDPFPLIHHGVPLRVRQVTVIVDRDKFMLNPSDCRPKRIVADFTSAQGGQARATAPFQASGCPALRFRPKLRLRLTGRKQTRTGKHPGVRAVVTQKPREAGIRRAEVRLPKALALDTDNAQALCEFEDGTKPDLERHCPKGSIVGRARAVSPLLERPLRGNVYFVKNVRRGPSGNLIRTLPMLIVALRSEIAVNLKGTSNVKRGKLVTTFANVPDAPISKFNLKIRGGRHGILTITRTARAAIDVCARRQIGVADFRGQNGRRYDRNIGLQAPCKSSKKGPGRPARKGR